jgi:hypothetical protein
LGGGKGFRNILKVGDKKFFQKIERDLKTLKGSQNFLLKVTAF